VSAQGRVVVVGGGIAGLAAAAQVAERLGPRRVVLVERAPRLGGKIATERAGRFLVEGGPDCFLAAKPAGMALCRALGIEDRVSEANPATRRTFVVRDARLHELPEGLTGLVPSRIRPLLGTKLLSPRGRLRAAWELFVARREDIGDESLAAFVARRFGAETWAWLVEPLLSGIYAGDGAALSLAATFPQLATLEAQHGSIVRSMLRARRRPGAPSALPTGFVTLPGGLAELSNALAERLPAASVRLGRTVTRVDRRAGAPGWILTLDDDTLLPAAAVILAIPSFAASRLVQPLDAELGRELCGIPYVSVATVSVGFDRAPVSRPLPGWGYVRPRAEGGDVVACTVTSNKFPRRAPEGSLLLRFFLGRSGRDDIATAGDEVLEDAVRRELRDMLGITAEPSVWHIRRWPNAMPQYILGHGDRVARIERRLNALPGLLVAGASYRGVGVPDCIASGWKAAETACESLQADGDGTAAAEPGSPGEQWDILPALSGAPHGGLGA